MNIYVARHGQTDWNIQKVLLGNTDMELNSVGKEQAMELKQKLDGVEFSIIISSPLKRAYETAMIVTGGKKDIIKNSNLKERNYGELEGTKPGENIFEYWNIETNKNDFKVESLKDFLNRVFNEMDNIIKEYNENNILIVTHHGVAMAIDAYFNGKYNYKFRDFKMNNCEYRKYII